MSNSITTGRSRGVLALIAGLALIFTLGAPVGAEESASEPNDPLWDQQWGPQQINAHLAWPTSTGEGTTIAIIDSGIDLTHEDLVGNVQAGTTYIDGCDDDEQNDNCRRDGDWQDGEEDGHPHGTHVAGIAGAVTDNGIGIAGIAPDTTLLAVKVLDQDGSGSYEHVAEGIRWSVDNGADVINLSLAAPPGNQVFVMVGAQTEVLEAIEYAHSSGVLVVAAAGNEAFPLCDDPAWSEGVVCVGGTDKRELPALYSNWPNKPDMIGVSAPGGSLLVIACEEGVVSTVPAGEGTESCDYPENQAYDEYDGTSMSAPHVAGVGALLYAMGCDREQAIDLITSTAHNPWGAPPGTWDPRYGYGIVDAEAAVTEATDVCSGAVSTDPNGDDDNGDDDNNGDNGDDDDRRNDEDNRRDNDNRRDGDDNRRDGENRDNPSGDDNAEENRCDGDNRRDGEDNPPSDEHRDDDRRCDEDRRQDADRRADGEAGGPTGIRAWLADLVATVRALATR